MAELSEVEARLSAMFQGRREPSPRRAGCMGPARALGSRAQGRRCRSGRGRSWWPRTPATTLASTCHGCRCRLGFPGHRRRCGSGHSVAVAVGSPSQRASRAEHRQPR